MFIVLYNASKLDFGFLNSFRLTAVSFFKTVGRHGSVGMANGYGPDCPGIESQRSTRYSASVLTGPGSHSASYTMLIGSFSRG